MSNKPRGKGCPSSQEKNAQSQDNIQAEISDIKKALGFVSDKLDVITNMQKELEKAMQTISKLQRDNKLKDEKIVSLENRLDDLEQYSKNDNVVITGLNLTYRSYKWAVADSSEHQRCIQKFFKWGQMPPPPQKMGAFKKNWGPLKFEAKTTN